MSHSKAHEIFVGLRLSLCEIQLAAERRLILHIFAEAKLYHRSPVASKMTSLSALPCGHKFYEPGLFKAGLSASPFPNPRYL